MEQFNSGMVKSGLVKLGQVKSGQVKMHLRIEFDSGVGPTCLCEYVDHIAATKIGLEIKFILVVSA